MPLALRLSTINGAKNETGKFWRSVFRQRPNYQGLWLVGPDGKVLSASMSYEAEWSAYFKWTAKVLAALNLGMDKFRPDRASSRPRRSIAAVLGDRSSPGRGRNSRRHRQGLQHPGPAATAPSE